MTVTDSTPDAAALRLEIVDRREARRESTASFFRDCADGTHIERRRVQDAAVVEFLDVADAVARRFIGRAQDGDDIRQVAYVGLVKAASRFDPEKGDDFVSFAVPTISGEIKRHLRDNGWVIRPPRRIQELRSRATSTGPRLAQQLGRTPTRAEIAEHLGETVADIEEAYRSQDGLTMASLDVTISEDEGLTLADAIGVHEPGHEGVELAADLRAAIRCLTPREKRIVYLRFFEDCTQQQIADDLGVTQMQVSRLIVKILDRLRGALVGGVASVPQLRPRRRETPQLKSA